MSMIKPEMTLGEIVSKFPSVVPSLNKYKIDYCCGGKDSLKKAVDESGTVLVNVIRELDSAISKADDSERDVRDWRGESMSSLIDHILSTHHVFMKNTMAELNKLLFTILKVHYKTDGPTLTEIHRLFGHLKTELEAHLVKEEEHLFPLILKYEGNKSPELKKQILSIIEDTESEHDAAGNIFKEIEQLTDDYCAPPHACETYKRTFHLLDVLEKDTFNHIHLENSVLFGKIY